MRHRTQMMMATIDPARSLKRGPISETDSTGKSRGSSFCFDGTHARGALGLGQAWFPSRSLPRPRPSRMDCASSDFSGGQASKDRFCGPQLSFVWRGSGSFDRYGAIASNE